MKNDFLEKMALQAAAEALKDGNASVKDAKSFAKKVLDLCDRNKKDVPTDKILDLKKDFPHLVKPSVLAVAEENWQAEEETVLKLRRLKGSNYTYAGARFNALAEGTGHGRDHAAGAD